MSEADTEYSVRGTDVVNIKLLFPTVVAFLLTATCCVAVGDEPFARAIELAQQRTVKVFGAGIGRTAGYASGVIVGPEGQILTAQGVFLGADNLRVTLP